MCSYIPEKSGVGDERNPKENGPLVELPDSDVIIAEPETKTKRPPFYKVVLLNDDYTPMDFVVLVLKSVFNKPQEEALRTMLTIHHAGSAVCGVYTRDVAETKVEIVVALARKNDHPLQCVMEKD